MKRKTKKLILSCTALLAFSTMAFGLVSIRGDVTAKASQSPVTILPTASVRLAKDENDKNGIRFESQVSVDYFENNTNAIYGTLICPADYLSQTNVLCHDDTANGELYLYDAENPNDATGNKNAVLDIRAMPELDEEANVYVFKGSITNVNDNNLARPFSARSYVGIPNGNGGYTYQYSEVYSRSIYSVATYAVADTVKYATYTPTQQSFLDNLTDKVAPSVTALTVSVDKAGEKLSTTDEVTVSATVTVDTKHYDGQLDVAPKFTATVDGTQSANALNRVDANVYTLTDLGNYTLTPYVGKTAKTTAENISLTCNMLSIFTKASDITTDNSGKLVNKYISASSDWDIPTGKLDFTNAKVEPFDGYENVLTYDIPKDTNRNSMIILQDSLLDKISIGTWLVFDIYMEDSANDKQAQYVYRANGGNDSYVGNVQWVHTANYSNTTKSYAKTYMYGFDENGNTITTEKAMGQQWYNGWGRFAVQFTDEGFEKFNFFMRTDLFSVNENATRKLHIKNMYLTTDGAPYCVEASGFDTTKKYATGETINLTATAYKDGVVVENTTNVFSVEGSASLNGNVLTVGAGEIKITVSNNTMNTAYPVSRTYTIQAETWNDLAVTGIDQSKSYKYNEIVELSATAVREGETQAQAVNASYEVTAGSAMVWQNSQGKWCAKPGVGDSEITVSYGGDDITVIFKGDADTIMLLGGATEQGYESDALLSNYFKEVTTVETPYTYELYNGRYAVNWHYADWQKGFALKDENAALANINGWLYIDLYWNGNQGNSYFFMNGKDFLYFFDGSYNNTVSAQPTMQNTQWQWYDMDGAPIMNSLQVDHYKCRWLTLEVQLEQTETVNRFVLSKYPGQETTKELYISSVVISKTRLVTQKQQANAEVLNILDDKQTFENYWAPAGTDSTFTWTTIEGRNAVQYKSLQADCSALYLDTIYKTADYNPLLPKYNYVYIDFYVEKDKAWNGVTVMLDFGGISPTYLTQYANTQAYDEGRFKHDNYYLGFNYQWYIDSDNDDVLEPLSSAPTSYKGVWVTLELCIPYNEGTYALKGYDIRIEKYPLDANVDNDLYISNVRLSKNSLTGIVTQ